METPNKSIQLPSLEVVKKVNKPFEIDCNLNWLLYFYYCRGEFDICKQLIEQQLNKQANPEYLFFVKGLIEQKECDYKNALKSFQKVIDINSNNIEVLKESGKTLCLMGRDMQALKILKQAEKMSRIPDADIYHLIGNILYHNAKLNKGNFSDALEYFQKAVQHGKLTESYQKISEIYRRSKDYVKAIEIIEECLQNSPDDTNILLELGVLYLKINETQNAFNILSDLMQLDGKCPTGLLAYGAILQSKNDYDGALKQYKQITNEISLTPEFWSNVGMCFFKMTDYEKAILCLRKAIWLSPTNYNILYNISLVFLTGLYASAFTTLTASINLRKESVESYTLLGICLWKLKDNKSALKALKTATTFPQSMLYPLTHLNFAILSCEMGNLKDSLESLKVFTEITQNTILPTEYKFSATKLKSILSETKNGNSMTNTVNFEMDLSNAKESSFEHSRNEDEEDLV